MSTIYGPRTMDDARDRVVALARTLAPLLKKGDRTARLMFTAGDFVEAVEDLERVAAEESDRAFAAKAVGRGDVS